MASLTHHADFQIHSFYFFQSSTFLSCTHHRHLSCSEHCTIRKWVLRTFPFQPLHGCISPRHLGNALGNGMVGCPRKVQVELLSGCDDVSLYVHVYVGARVFTHVGACGGGDLFLSSSLRVEKGSLPESGTPISLTTRMACQQSPHEGSSCLPHRHPLQHQGCKHPLSQLAFKWALRIWM